MLQFCTLFKSMIPQTYTCLRQSMNTFGRLWSFYKTTAQVDEKSKYPLVCLICHNCQPPYRPTRICNTRGISDKLDDNHT